MVCSRSSGRCSRWLAVDQALTYSSGTHLQHKMQGKCNQIEWYLMSNLSASRYRGAYCTEHESEVLDVFGKIEVVADTLPAMADKIIAATK